MNNFRDRHRCLSSAHYFVSVMKIIQIRDILRKLNFVNFKDDKNTRKLKLANNNLEIFSITRIQQKFVPFRCTKCSKFLHCLQNSNFVKIEIYDIIQRIRINLFLHRQPQRMLACETVRTNNSATHLFVISETNLR